MGYAMSWIALKEKEKEKDDKDKTGPPAAGLLALSCSGSGQSGEVPEGMFSAASLGNGWYVVVMDKCARKFVNDRSVERLSASGAMAAAAIEEHAIFCSAPEWIGGSRIWRVDEAAESGPRHPEEHSGGRFSRLFPSTRGCR
jgi:hypothetical protein